MIRINKRSVGLSIILSLVTLGIYGIYWMYLLVKNTRSIQKNTGSCVKEMLCLFLIPYYSIYWWYITGVKTKHAFDEHHHFTASSGVVYLVLSLLGLNLVAMAVMQNDFNSLPTAEQPSAVAQEQAA